MMGLRLTDPTRGARNRFVFFARLPNGHSAAVPTLPRSRQSTDFNDSGNRISAGYSPRLLHQPHDAIDLFVRVQTGGVDNDRARVPAEGCDAAGRVAFVASSEPVGLRFDLGRARTGLASLQNAPARPLPGVRVKVDLHPSVRKKPLSPCHGLRLPDRPLSAQTAAGQAARNGRPQRPRPATPLAVTRSLRRSRSGIRFPSSHTSMRPSRHFTSIARAANSSWVTSSSAAPAVPFSIRPRVTAR